MIERTLRHGEQQHTETAQMGKDDSNDRAWRLRGIRGATTVPHNTPDEIRFATRELLNEMVHRNALRREDVASAYFTTTPDLDAEFPAVVARRDFGWDDVALMCGHEMSVPGSLRQCLRILLHVNSQRRQNEVEFVYLRGARARRPDLEVTESDSSEVPE